MFKIYSFVAACIIFTALLTGIHELIVFAILLIFWSIHESVKELM